MRKYGPTDGRFDHHLPPPRVQGRGILYCANDIVAVMGEAFQSRRAINRHWRKPRLAGFRTTTDIDVLDMTGAWPTRAGASQAIASGSRKRAREWSRLIYELNPLIAGLRYRTKMHGGAISLALYERAEGSLPGAPEFDRALDDGAMTGVVLTAARDLGYSVL